MKLAFGRRPILILLLAFSFYPRPSAEAVPVEVEELRRVNGELADIRDANVAYQRRLSQMQKEIESLRDALREVNERTTTKLADFTTREDLKKIAEKIEEVDQRREADRKLILEEFEKLGRSLAQPVERPERSSSRKRDREREKEPEPEAAPEKPIEGTFYPYKVQSGQVLSDIISAFNKQLREEGRPTISMSQVKRANPKLNPDLIRVGDEILLPVPDKKK
jgi:LysM repeat protein